MKIHDLRDYYKRQEAAAALQYVAQPDGLNKESADETFQYFREQHHIFARLCGAAKL